MFDTKLLKSVIKYKRGLLLKLYINPINETDYEYRTFSGEKSFSDRSRWRDCLMYHVADGALDVRHTIVPGEIGGRGIASALVKAAYDYALANELVPVATCSYAVKWLERHPEYNGKTGKDYAGEGTCAL